MSRDKIEKWDEVNGITAPERKLEAFLESSTDTYAILQLRDSEDTRTERFVSYSALQRQEEEPEIDHYEVVYMAPLPPFQDKNAMLYISEELTIPHGQSDHLSRRFRSLISERDSRRSKSFL